VVNIGRPTFISAAVRFQLDQLNKESNSISKEVGQIKKVRDADSPSQAVPTRSS
jgi:hypothetical protein